MATIKVRYVTKRIGNGREYWYWQRRGFPLHRLPDDLAKRLFEAERLNTWADSQGSQKARHADDSISRLVRNYEETNRYKILAEGTRTYYDRKLRDIIRVWGDLPVSFLTRKAVVDFVESYKTPGERKKAAAVLYNLFDLAVYRGWAEANLAKSLRLTSPPAGMLSGPKTIAMPSCGNVVRWVGRFGRRSALPSTSPSCVTLPSAPAI